MKMSFFWGNKKEKTKTSLVEFILIFASVTFLVCVFLLGSLSRAEEEVIGGDVGSETVAEDTEDAEEEDGDEEGGESEFVDRELEGENEDDGGDGLEGNGVDFNNKVPSDKESGEPEGNLVESDDAKIQMEESLPMPLLQTVQENTNDSDGDGDDDKNEKDEIKFGDVVINEIAWMGTEASSNDEWIELKNEIDEKIDLDGWVLEMGREDKEKNVEPRRIELTGDILGGGYFLLERTNDDSVLDVEADQIYTGALKNSGEYLKLENKGGDTVDEVDAEGGWLAGDNESKKTMERDRGDWKDSKCSGGTPRAKNGTDDFCKPTQVCGNFILEEDEECDDGNVIDGDGCSTECLDEQSGGGGDDLPGRILINEVLLAEPEFSKNEFVELFNPTDKEIDLNGWSLKKKTKSGSESNLLSSSKFEGKIGSGDYFTIAHPDYFSIESADEEYSGSSYSISKDNSVLLYGDEEDSEGNKVLIDALCWGECEHECSGIRFKENPKDGSSIALKDVASMEYAITKVPTPGEENFFPVPKIYSKLVRFNEVLPNPSGVDKNNEWIELKNNDSKTIDLSGWEIENGSGKNFTIEKGEIKPKRFLAIKIKNSSMSIRNSNEKLALLDPNGEAVDAVEYIESARSGLSFNANSQGKWKWSRFLTPNKTNRFNHLPKIRIKKPKKVYKNIYAEFDASKTTDGDRDKLKFKWDFGDGHKSYLEETRHKYEKKGKYKVTLTVDDGSEKVSKTFKVEVKSFPRRELVFVRLMPNPDGKDKGNEIIVIRNLYKKKLNLEGFKIATGSSESKLVNHPIYDDFVIDSNEEEAIFNDDTCKFSLLNKKGVVALLYPDGKIADIVFYEKEKITPNEEYVLVDQQWEWVGGEADAEPEGNATIEVVAGDSTEHHNPFDFFLITKNEQEQICECLGKIMIENWKSRNVKWLEQLNFQLIDKLMAGM